MKLSGDEHDPTMQKTSLFDSNSPGPDKHQLQETKIIYKGGCSNADKRRSTMLIPLFKQSLSFLVCSSYLETVTNNFKANKKPKWKCPHRADFLEHLLGIIKESSHVNNNMYTVSWKSTIEL